MRPAGITSAGALLLSFVLASAVLGSAPLQGQAGHHGFPGVSDVPGLAGLQGPVQLAPPMSPVPRPLVLPGTAGPACEDGVVYDDGELDRGVGDQEESFVTLAMAFDVPPGSKVEEVCVCWTRTGDFGLQEYELLFFADDGPDGGPGTQLGIAFPTVQNVPPSPEGLFHGVVVDSLDVRATSGRIYIAAEWFPGLGDEFFLCGDTDGGGSQPLYVSNDQGATWDDLREVEAGDPRYPDELDSLMIRALFSPPDDGPGDGPCIPGPTTLCLQDGRFRIEVDFATPQGDTGIGRQERLTSDTGYFWFFNEENVELVIKVLDACSFADRFWVFAGGLTNVEVEITVTDTEHDVTSVYRNPLGQPFLPIQDTVAFNTCP